MASDPDRRRGIGVPERFQAIRWRDWRPTETATLLFVIDGERVLLIRKKRGLGKGKINGPGGRIEGTETAVDCAIRETHEELKIKAFGVGACGRLDFQFVDGYALRCHVFRAAGFTGRPAETDEALPIWTPVAAIPYDQMWADDRFWLPMLLRGEPFVGRFLFDDDRLLGHRFDPPNVLRDLAHPT